MGRGVKIDLAIGATIESGWCQVQEVSRQESPNVIVPSKHSLVCRREKRRGNVVTCVGPFQLHKEDASAVLKQVKKKLGCGGSYKAPWMEFQGELTEKLKTLLKQEGFGFKS